MKKTFRLGVCTLLVFVLAAVSAPAGQDEETPVSVREAQTGEIKELTIKNTGFLSRSVIVIRYRADDKKIIDVIENGKKLPSSEFSRYESVIRKVMEIPEIDRLLPDIDRAKRMAESARISEESKIREMLALRSRLEDLKSDEARRYRDFNELLLMETFNKMTEKIRSSNELSREEKILQLKGVLEKINALEQAEKEEERRRRFAQFEAGNAMRSLIAEIYKSSVLSNEAKIKELNRVLEQMRDINRGNEEALRDEVEIEAAEMLRNLLREVYRNRELAEHERVKESERIMREARNMQLKAADKILDIEKFKFELHQLLKKEGLLPEGEAEFVLKSNECTIDGKRLPKEIHGKIMDLCEEILGKKFDKDTKIVLRLNE